MLMISPLGCSVNMCSAKSVWLTVYTKSCRIESMVRGKTERSPWGSKQVRALRRHLGLTQSALADQLGTRQQTISEWEKGMYQPRGASSTLLSIVAEQARFEYQATPSNKKTEKP